MPVQEVDHARARWYMGGCSTLFAVPFFIAGVTVMRLGIQTLRGGGRDGLLLLVFGSVFAAMSVGIVAVLWQGMSSSAGAIRRSAAHPMQPWLWRDDWAEGRIREQSWAPASWGLLIFAVMWNAIAFPVAAVAFRAPQRGVAAFVLIFPLIGVVLLLAALYSLFARRKFGRSVLSLDHVPIVPGRPFYGEIQHRGNQVPESGYELTLRCVNRVVNGASRRRNVSEDVMWETSQRISAAVAAPSPNGMRVPFSFDIPADARSSDLRNANDQIVWRLVARAALPGVDYNASFELPLFATAGEGDVAAYHVAHREAAAQQELTDPRVTMTQLPSGGVELRIGPRHDSGAVVTFLVFAAIWFGAIGLMWRFGAPVAIAVFFSVFGLIILLMAVDYFIGVSRVQADASGLRIRREWFGAGTTTTVPADDVESVTTKLGGRSGRQPYFDVEARRSRGNTTALARYFHTRDDAEIFAAKVWAAMGK